MIPITADDNKRESTADSLLLLLFLYVDGGDFRDIGTVVGVIAEEFFWDTVVGEEAFFFEVVAVELTADDNHFSFFKAHAAVDFHGSETCFLSLVAVSARMSAAERKSSTLIFAEERSSKGVAVFHEFVSIAVRSDVACEDVHIPDNTELSP